MQDNGQLVTDALPPTSLPDLRQAAMIAKNSPQTPEDL
jgi:hypothetical protein